MEVGRSTYVPDLTEVSSSEDDSDEDLPIPPFVVAGPSTNLATIPLGL